MNKKINIIILLFFFMFMLNITYVDAACIDSFGSITNITTGSDNNAAGGDGNVDYSDRNTDGTWSDKEVTFNVQMQAQSWYKVSEIYYSIESDDILSCKGQLDSSAFISNTGSVSFSVKINKAYVHTITFYGKTQERGGDVEKSIQSEKYAVRFKETNYMPNVGITTAPSGVDGSEEDIGVGESLACKDFGDFFDRYWKMVCILMPIVLILLVSIDFVRATVSDSTEETMKKMTTTAMKRTIALILLIWLPILCRIIFKLFNIEFCL